MRKICRSSQFMTKILSEENVFQISAVPTGVYVCMWTLPSHVKVLWFVSFPRCTAGPNINGSSWIRLHTQCTTANTEATTPNVVGPTMLGVLAPVCSNLQKKKLPVDVTSDLAKADWERVTRVSVRSFFVLPNCATGA